MTDWQDIASAPRDGSDFHAVDGRTGHQEIVFFDDTRKSDVTQEWVWHTKDGPAYHERFFTHWRPLPSPPGQTDREAK